MAHIAPIIPINPIMPSNSDLDETLPFKDCDVTRELRTRILQRTKQRWIWFSEAEDLDKQRGTKLGTLGHLPWEIRQKIIEAVFNGEFHGSIRWCGYGKLAHNIDDKPRFYLDDSLPRTLMVHPPVLQSIASLRIVSASMNTEVEYTLLTKTDFKIESPDALEHFLGRLTAYQQSLLRSITIPVFDLPENCKGWMDVLVELPSELKSIKFIVRFFQRPKWEIYEYEYYSRKELPRNLLKGLELLGKRIKRCSAPKARIEIQSFLGEGEGETFEELEEFMEWLECWRASRRDFLLQKQLTVS